MKNTALNSSEWSQSVGAANAGSSGETSLAKENQFVIFLPHDFHGER